MPQTEYISPRIQMLSLILTRICMGLLILLPIAVLVFWVKLDWFYGSFTPNFNVTTFDIMTQIYGLLFSLIPLAMWMYGLVILRRLFTNYRLGRIFLSDNARYIKYFAWVTIISGALSPLFRGVFSVIFSMNHAAGERFISIGLGTTEIYTILQGLVFVVIAHVMEAAHKISEENKQFI